MSADKIHHLPDAGGRLSLLQWTARLYHTLRPLRWQQYWYRAWYPLKRKAYRAPAVPPEAIRTAAGRPQRALFALPAFDRYDPAGRTFRLLGLERAYPAGIDWNDTRHGLLWAYHLNYFGWLGDGRLTIAERHATIRAYTDAGSALRVGTDSYPVSLRAMNWIRFFLNGGVRDEAALDLLYRHCHRLAAFPEYHLQGNHLWENGCALLTAGWYFGAQAFLEKGRTILTRALAEQVLQDGGHIEGSPMYHSLLLSRLLQCIELTEQDMPADLRMLMREKATLMLGWLEAVAFSDGSLPRLGDSTGGIAPDMAALRKFAERLGISARPVRLQESGYRMFRHGLSECIVDAGNIRPAWQPGHAHADTFTFCLSVGGRPVLVDPGCSSYAPGPVRSRERSTDYHNTVNIGGRNSTDVWSSFRTGRKARVRIITEEEDRIEMEHDGYAPEGILHRRTLIFSADRILLKDKLNGIKGGKALLNLHLHPDMSFKKIRESKFLAGNLQIEIEHAQSVSIEPYRYAVAFNHTLPAQRLHIELSSATLITIENSTC